MRRYMDQWHGFNPSADAASGRTSASGASDWKADNEQSIAQTADAFGVSMRTLRFYETKGLLKPRRIGNRRFYDEACRARLRLVLKGKAMGFGLDEIGELVAVVESDMPDGERATAVRKLSERQRDVLLARRELLNEQIEETTRVIDGLISI